MSRRNEKVYTTTQIEQRFRLIRTVAAVAISLVIAFGLIATVSDQPFADLMTFIFGPLESLDRLDILVQKMIPLLFTGTAVCLMYSCGQINLAAEGAFFAGAYAATAIAIQGGIMAGLHPVLSILFGGLAGAIICVIPGIMHVKFNVMTVVSSLMINYVSLYLGLYLIMNVMLDPSAGYNASYPFADTAKLPIIIPDTGIHLGLIIGILVVFGGWWLLYRSTFGYSIRAIGRNQEFAKYSGIKVGSIIIATQALAGFLAGIGGSIEVLGLYNRFNYGGLTSHGWDGVMLAVIAGNNPKNIPFAALFLAYIRTATDVLNRESSVPTEVVKIVQAVIIVFIAATGFLSGWEHRTIVKNSQRRLSLETAAEDAAEAKEGC